MTTIILPHAGHITEFADGFNGTCTQTALEVCIAASTGRAPTTDDMVHITRDMIAKKLCSPNGAATIAAITQEARDLGSVIQEEWDFGGMKDWITLLRQNAGVQPILLQVANGQALVDVETGARDEAGLHYHAIAVVGKQDNGYIVADSDNPQVTDRFQVYPLDTLKASQPCGLLMIGMKVEPEPALPPGATDDGTTLTWNGFTVTGPFRAWCIAHVFALGAPVHPLESGADGNEQIFQLGALRWTQADGVFEASLGADYLAALATIATLTQKLAAVEAAIKQ